MTTQHTSSSFSLYFHTCSSGRLPETFCWFSLLFSMFLRIMLQRTYLISFSFFLLLSIFFCYTDIDFRIKRKKYCWLFSRLSKTLIFTNDNDDNASLVCWCQEEMNIDYKNERKEVKQVFAEEMRKKNFIRLSIEKLTLTRFQPIGQQTNLLVGSQIWLLLFWSTNRNIMRWKIRCQSTKFQ